MPTQMFFLDNLTMDLEYLLKKFSYHRTQRLLCQMAFCNI